MAPKDTLVWPDGSVYRITRSSEQTGGDLLEMEWDLPSNGWAPSPHIHPTLTENYGVVEGSLEVFKHGSWQLLEAGGTATVPAGTVHTFRTTGRPARVRNTHSPALDFEPYIRELCDAANRHDLGDLGGLRALLQIAVLIREYPLHSRAPQRPLNAAVPVLAAIGRGLGFGRAAG